MFALDDFLCGFCNSVELYILCSLLEILYLKFHTLIDCLNDLQLCLIVENLLHVCYFLIASLLDFIVFLFKDLSTD